MSTRPHRVALDFEFLNQGQGGLLLPISLGAVRDDGEEFYAEFSDCPPEVAASLSPFLAEHVVPQLMGDGESTTRVRERFHEFAGPQPEFWGYLCGLDYTLLSRMHGPFDSGLWPEGWPYYINDLAQAGAAPEQGSADDHHALADARRIMAAVLKMAGRT